jgi:hypothetical protein
MSSGKPIVMGSATNLPASHFLPFFQSLRATGYDGHTCVFFAGIEPAEQARLAEVVDELVCVDPAHPAVAPEWTMRALGWSKRTHGLRRHFPTLCHLACRVRRAGPASGFANDLEVRLQGLQSLRYAHYLEYLRHHTEFTQVMISDLRDVIFQRDPFAAPVASLEVFLEEPEMTFGVDGFNRRWISDLYGESGVSELGDRIVSCSGVTFGTRDLMTGYLRVMADEVRRHLPPLGPHDQAMHNWLLYTGRFDGSFSVSNGYGRVLTMGAQHHVEVSADGTVLNRDGSVPAVLHQYDRHVALAPRLLASF